MSIKAYDGMKCDKDLHFIQDEILKRIDKFRELSINKLASTYADIIVKHTDENYDIRENVEFDVISEQQQLDEIKKIEPTNIISYLYQTSKILSKSSRINDFMVNLRLTLDCIDGKILIYPMLIVNGHRNILLEFLDDWYFQNQSDPDEDVPENEWLERKKDWVKFNEHDYFKTEIKLFDPNDYLHSLNINLRGDKLINKIIEFIPSDEKRIEKIAINEIVNSKLSNKPSYSEHINIYNEVINNKQFIDDYIKNNNIKLTVIDKDYLTKTIV